MDLSARRREYVRRLEERWIGSRGSWPPFLRWSG